MRKLCKSLFTWFSIVVMVLGFYMPNFALVVHATEGDTGSEEVAGPRFTGVMDGKLEMKLDDGSRSIKDESGLYKVVHCYSDGNAVTTVIEDNACKISPFAYGITYAVITYENENGEQFKDKITVDVEIDEYLDYFIKKVPTEYDQSSSVVLENYIRDFLPSGVTVATSYDGSSCYWRGEDYDCKVSIRYFYSDYNLETSSYDYKYYFKDTTTRMIASDSSNSGFNTLHLYSQNLLVGQTKDFLEEYSYGDINDYFWVSDAPEVAYVNTSNQLVGVSVGTANIRLVNKQTLEYKSFKVIVEADQGVKNVNELKSLFSGEVVIDISNDLGASYSEYSTYTITEYFNHFASSLVDSSMPWINSTGINCGDDFKNCSISFQYYMNNNGTISDQTELFDVKFKGMYVKGVEGVYANSVGGKRYAFVNNEITINNILKFDEGDITYSFDTNYLKQDESDSSKFVTLKEGSTKVTLYNQTAGTMTSFDLIILFNENDRVEIQNFFGSLEQLDIPYTRDVSSSFIEKYIRSYINISLEGNSILPYLNVEVTDVINGDVYLGVNIIYDGNHVYNIINFSEKFINLNYDSDSENNLYNELNSYINNIPTRYELKEINTMYNRINYSSEKDFFESLVISDSTFVENAQTSLFTYDVELIGTYKIQEYLYTNAKYLMSIYYNSELLYSIELYAVVDFVIDPSPVENNSEAERIRFLNEYFAGFGHSGITITPVEDNFYKIDKGNDYFHVLLDQKDLVYAKGISLNSDYNSIISLNESESHTLDYSIYPFGATAVDLALESGNSDVVSVVGDNTFTGVAKGFTNVNVFAGSNYHEVFVAVGYKGTELLDSIVSSIDKNLVVYHNEIRWQSLDEAIASKINNAIYDKTKMNLYLQVEVISADDGYVDVVLRNGNLSSSKVRFNYSLEGIYAEGSVFDVEVGESRNIGLKFTEGDLSNLRYRVMDPEIATFDNKGNLTGLKKGMTTIDVFDKYNKYFMNIEVHVSFDEFVSETVDYLQNNKVKITNEHLNGYTSWNDVSSVLSDILYEQGIDLYSMFNPEYGMGYDFDSTTNSVIYSFHGVNEQTELTIPVEFEGFFLFHPIVYLDVDDTYEETFEFKNGTFEISATSMNTDVCTVSGLTVTAVDSGTCEVVYSSEEYSIKQYFIVNVGSFKQELNNILNEIDDTIDVKLDEFDAARAGQYEYSILYDAAVRSYLNSIINNYDNVSLNNSYIASSRLADSVAYSLVYNEIFEFDYTIKYLTLAQTDTETLNVNYLGHSDGWEDRGANIVKNIQEEYVLSVEQVMEFLLSGDDTYYIEYYSDFIDDIEEKCPTCTFEKGQGGSSDGGNGIINAGFDYIIFDGNEPIALGSVSFVANIVLDIEEIDNHDKIDERLKKKIKDEYIKHRDKHRRSTYQLLRGTRESLNNNWVNLTTDDDIVVDLTRVSSVGNILKYYVEVDGYQFETSVMLNILSENQVYSQGGLRGDIDLDGNINITDLVRLRKYLAGTETLTDEQKVNADVNKDNVINITDLVRIRKYLAGSEEL